MLKQIKPISIFLFLLLSACGNVGLSPEAAATKMLLEESTQGMQIYDETLKVRQTLLVEDDMSIVAITFTGTRPEIETIPLTCFYTYQTFKKEDGWVAANGGGICQESQPEQQINDIDVMVRNYSGQSPDETGYTQIYGSVINPNIVKVQVIWEDDVVTQVDVVDGTMLTIRKTQLKAKKVEGMNEQDQVIYSHFMSGASDSQT